MLAALIGRPSGENNERKLGSKSSTATRSIDGSMRPPEHAVRAASRRPTRMSFFGFVGSLSSVHGSQ